MSDATSETLPSNGTIIATGLDLPEGPCFDRSGALYVSEVVGGRVIRLAGDDRTVVSSVGGPNGATFGPDGCHYAMNNGGRLWGEGDVLLVPTPDNTGGYVQQLTPEGEITQLYTECDGEALVAPNDVVFDADGSFYFTDTRGRLGPGAGYVFWATIDGKAIKKVWDGLNYPNGIAITDDGATLIVGETRPGRLLARDITAPGVLGEPRVYCEMPSGAHTDGMAFDEAGWLLVTSPNTPQIAVFDDCARYVESIDTGDPHTTNVAFGGPDFSTLYVTLSSRGNGRLGAFPWRRAGMRLFPDR
jgi:gluconolactonase